MSRKPKIEFPGAFYHVLARGNNKQKIFNDRQDYCVYVERLKRYQERYKFALYAYVLMVNHIHLLIETGMTPLISKARSIFVYVAVRHVGMSNKSVAEFLQRDMSTISCMVRRIDKEIKNDKILKEQMEEVIKVIKA